jgi:hypothetical protein
VGGSDGKATACGYSETDKSFHLSKEKAAELMTLVVDAYVGRHQKPPSELFIHGQIRFDRHEWASKSSNFVAASTAFGNNDRQRQAADVAG